MEPVRRWATRSKSKPFVRPSRSRTWTGPARVVLGSVKSNIGHLDAASGVAGLIKTILCLKNQAIPPTLHYTAPNPELHLERTSVRRSEPLHTLGIRCAPAGWSELVRCRWHQCSRRPRGGAADLRRRTAPSGPQVLLLSARTAESLQDARAALAAELSRDEQSVAARRGVHARGSAVLRAPDGGRRGRPCRRRRCADRRGARQGFGRAVSAGPFAGRKAGGVPVSWAGRAARRHGPRPLRHRTGVPGELRPVRSRIRRGTRHRPEGRGVRRDQAWSPPIWPSRRCSRWNTRWRS